MDISAQEVGVAVCAAIVYLWDSRKIKRTVARNTQPVSNGAIPAITAQLVHLTSVAERAATRDDVREIVVEAVQRHEGLAHGVAPTRVHHG